MNTPAQLVAHLAGTRDGEALLWLQGEDGMSYSRPSGYSDVESAEAARRMKALGLLQTEVSAAGEWEFTSMGREVAQMLQTSQNTGPLRRAAVQKALLEWLDDERGSSTQAFVGELVAGTPAGDKEVVRAVEFLKSHNLMEGFGTGQGLHMVRPSITYLGVEAKDDPRTPFDFVQQGGTTIYDTSSNVNFSGGQNAGVQIGNHNHQVVTAHFSPGESSEVEKLLDLLKEELQALKAAGEDTGQADAAVESMSAALAADSRDRTVLMAPFTSFMTGLATKFVDPAYQEIAQIAQSLGGLISG